MPVLSLQSSSLCAMFVILNCACSLYFRVRLNTIDESVGSVLSISHESLDDSDHGGEGVRRSTRLRGKGSSGRGQFEDGVNARKRRSQVCHPRCLDGLKLKFVHVQQLPANFKMLLWGTVLDELVL